MALPWLESHNVWGDEPRSNEPVSEAPVRLAVVFSGNGYHSKEWWAKGDGPTMELGKVLAPLADYREKMVFINGLYHEQARKGNIHSSQTGNLLSGAPLANGGRIRSGTSFKDVATRILESAQVFSRQIHAPCGRIFSKVPQAGTGIVFPTGFLFLRHRMSRMLES